MNIETIFSFLDTNNIYFRNMSYNIDMADSYQRLKVKKIENKCIEMINKFLSIDECTVKKALIFYRMSLAIPLNLYQLACWGDMRQLRDYIEEKKLLPEQAMRRTFKNNVSDLTWAVLYNDLEFVRERLLLGTNVNTYSEEESLLSIAARKGHTAMVELLLSFNPDVNLTFPFENLLHENWQRETDTEETYQIARLFIQHGANIFIPVRTRFIESWIRVPVSEAVQGTKLRPLLLKVIQIKTELNAAIMLLIKGQRDPHSLLSLLPIELIKKINDTARFTLVLSWAEERMATD